jgi:predicted TIM-barrel fold metal-dependent hydrolase
LTPSHARTDAHIHLFRDGFVEGGRDELAWYEELRATAGVTAALVVGYEGSPRFAGNNAHILELSRRVDWVHPTAFVDVAAPPSPAALRKMREDGFTGWSIYLPEEGPSLSDWSSEQLTALAGGVLSVNASPAALDRARSAFTAIAETRVLVSHLGLPGSAARDADTAAARDLLGPLLALAPLDHIAVKLSGLYAIDPRSPHLGARTTVDAVLDVFGADRIAWGSDFSPVLSEVAPDDAMVAPEWILTGLSPSETDAILGGTLLRHLAHVDSIGGTDA